MKDDVRVTVLDGREVLRDGAIELLRGLSRATLDDQTAADRLLTDRDSPGQPAIVLVALELDVGGDTGEVELVQPRQGETNAEVDLSRAPVGPSATPALTARELAVLRALARDGETNRNLAGELEISEATVKRHLATIFSKFGVRTRMQAVRRAEALGLLNA